MSHSRFVPTLMDRLVKPDVSLTRQELFDGKTAFFVHGLRVYIILVIIHMVYIQLFLFCPYDHCPSYIEKLFFLKRIEDNRFYIFLTHFLLSHFLFINTKGSAQIII